MFNAVRYDDELTGLDNLFTVTEFHEQASPMNKEQLIVALTEGPARGSLKLGDLDLHVVALPLDLAGKRSRQILLDRKSVV